MAGPKIIRNKSGLKSDGSPNAHWLKFQERIKSFQNTPIQDWTEEHILGYTLSRFESHYQIPYTLSFSGPPTKCQEMYCIRRTLAALGTQKGWIAKQYIDWVWDTKIIPKKVSISSLAFFFTTAICNEFKPIFRKNNTITRSSELPLDYQSISDEMKLPVKTYGDLAFIKLALENNKDDYPDYENFFNKIKELGFDDSILVAI